MRGFGFSPAVVLDVGAARGDWTISARRIFPSARFVMVEPLPDWRDDLEAITGLGIDYVPAAAGAKEATLPLLVPDQPGGSSFLSASREGDTYFKRSVNVPVVTLDSLDIPEGPTLLKLDVQGYELEVLEGGSRVLEQVEVLVAECSLYPFQTDIPLVHDVVRRVADLGLVVYDVADELRWPSGALAQVDLIFVASGSRLLHADLWH
jgi:FkbM family methyltransferase